MPIPAPTPVDVPAPVAEGATGPELVHRDTVPGRFSARIPDDLVETFERAYGVEVADVTVDRSPEAGARAKAIGARAFAHQDLIVLPEDAGPVESVATRALLGHELAHVVQQRTIGSLPTESDTDGQRLEAAARSVEEWVRAGAAGPPPPAVPPQPGTPPEASERPGPAPVRRRASAGPPSSAGAPQRAESGVATAPAPTPAQQNTPRVVTSTSGGNNTVATGAGTATPTLVHPATRSTQPDPMNPTTMQQYRTELRESFEHFGADMLGLGGLIGGGAAAAQPSNTPQVNRPASSTSTATGTTTPAGGTTGGTGTGTTGGTTGGAGFNRDARREQLQNDALERLNMVRGQQGESPLAELPATEQAAIEAQLDSEQASGGGGAGGNGLPVVRSWSDFGNQFRTAGGGLLGDLIGYDPAAAADRRRQEEEQARQQQQQAAAGNTTTSTAGAAAAAATGGAVAAGAVGHPDRPLTLETTGADLTRLYDRIHTRLVRELLVGRERSGSLMDFR
jgi:hypothetical protein